VDIHHFPDVVLDEYAIMPDHFHGILVIKSRDKEYATSERTPIKDVPTMFSIIGGFKSITTTIYAKNVRNNDWQPFRNRLWQ